MQDIAGHRDLYIRTLNESKANWKREVHVKQTSNEINNLLFLEFKGFVDNEIVECDECVFNTQYQYICRLIHQKYRGVGDKLMKIYSNQLCTRRDIM